MRLLKNIKYNCLSNCFSLHYRLRSCSRHNRVACRTQINQDDTHDAAFSRSSVSEFCPSGCPCVQQGPLNDVTPAAGCHWMVLNPPSSTYTTSAKRTDKSYTHSTGICSSADWGGTLVLPILETVHRRFSVQNGEHFTTSYSVPVKCDQPGVFP